ncbi:hypothetical protein ALC62_10473 [Cyphomyrmex costatus]|uniref:Uncharacterized protein n=1 Tax=Cyphomyrmex costatus TaxID=456900 RepID=A0A151IDM2_9HYME|nr:hypothetical protein ALC62_10473 [Cyphomyrmex costatus]
MYDIPGWRGYHEQITRHKSVEKTKVLFLPFINAPPSDYDTIYTALKMAAQKAKDLQLQTTIVTIDQPLYIKGRDIVACSKEDSELKNIIVRLGGFHTLMSFLGCIGFIMAGSGLREVLSVIYAPNSVDKLLAGHAYARAVRAHLLLQLALSKIILQTLPMTNEERESVISLLLQFRENPPKTEEINEHPVVTQLTKKLETHLLQFDNNGPTAKLWMQYFHMVTIMKLFIESERDGNWTNHLLAVRYMLPYFHSSGHFSYAKSCHIYLQDMANLKNVINDIEFQQFTEGRKFTTKRTDKFWSGTWSDQIIEQTLNREFKFKGGPIGRGPLSDSALTSFTVTMPILHNICEAVENFSEKYFSTSEQHVEARESRIKRDEADLQKLVNWFEIHDPFPQNDCIVSLSTGMCGNSSTINCFRAREIGEQLIENIQDKKLKDIQMKRSQRVSSLASVNCTVKIQDKEVTVDPLKIFQRMTIAKQSESDLQEFLKFELSPYPLSLFCETDMRKNKKSALMNVFPVFGNDLPDGDKKFIIDGGFLLHRVVWNINTTYKTICMTYVNYVKKYYGNNCIVVFDGYDNTSNNTKASEQYRRSSKKSCPDIVFEEHMVATIAQESFLRNNSNKSRLITLLKHFFEMDRFVVYQDDRDADSLIIKSVISAATSNVTVVVVGEDTDLLVLLIALTPSNENVYFLKPGKGKSEKQIFSS